jgi:HEAT repeat protein
MELRVLIHKIIYYPVFVNIKQEKQTDINKKIINRETMMTTTNMLPAIIAAALFVHGAGVLQAAHTKTTVRSTTVVSQKAEAKAVPDKTTKKEATKKSDSAAKKDIQKESSQTDEKKAEWIEQTLDFGIQEDRAKAIQTIPQIKEKGIREKLVKKLIETIKDEEDPEVLKKAITVLGEMKESSSVPVLTDKINHLSEDVRTAAVYALKNMNAVAAKEKLIQKLKEQKLENNSNFTDALIQTLGEMKAVELVPFAKESLENAKTHEGVRESLVVFLGKAQSKDSKDILLKIYKDEDADTTLRAFSVNSLSKLGMKEVSGDIKETIKAIDSYDPKKKKNYYTLYLYSVAALARLGDQEAVPKLINALRSNSAQVRLKAITLIKEFKDKRTIDILKYKMKYDQNDKVRAEAKKALKEMGVEVKEEKEEIKEEKKADKKVESKKQEVKSPKKKEEKN